MKVLEVPVTLVGKLTGNEDPTATRPVVNGDTGPVASTSIASAPPKNPTASTPNARKEAGRRGDGEGRPTGQQKIWRGRRCARKEHGGVVGEADQTQRGDVVFLFCRPPALFTVPDSQAASLGVSETDQSSGPYGGHTRRPGVDEGGVGGSLPSPCSQGQYEAG